MTSPLPTPRRILTSVIKSLSTTQPAPVYHIAAVNRESPSKPLKDLSSSHRNLLSTLHVLFPPGMLLQSFDLLDRGLVTRLVQATTLEEPISTATRPGIQAPQAHGNLREFNAEDVNAKMPEPQSPKNNSHEQNFHKKNKIYQVRSSQASKSRFKDSGTAGSSAGAGSLVYAVRLEAWNCTCAAFAFAAFPSTFTSTTSIFPHAGLSSYSSRELETDTLDKERQIGRGSRERKEEEGEGEWEFGGLSFDGREGREVDQVPCCKHLLACLLVERWEGVLGQYVYEKVVESDEMAGFGGES